MFKETISNFPIPRFTLKEITLSLVFIVGIVISGSGFYMVWAYGNQAHSELGNADVLQIQNNQSETITIDVGGAIHKPGIYTFSYDARVAQVIEKAGGFEKNADPYFITHSLNLASTLQDGQKIYIPFKNETPVGSQAEDTGISARSNSTTAISINTGSKDELDTLEGIGEKRAEDIIANRPYTKIEELVSKKILTQTQFESISAFIKL